MNKEVDKHCKQQSKLNIHNLIFSRQRKKGEETWCVLSSTLYIPSFNGFGEMSEKEFVFEICGTLLYNMNKLSRAPLLTPKLSF